MLVQLNSDRPTTQMQLIQEDCSHTEDHLFIFQLTLLDLFFLTEHTMIEHHNEGLLAPSIELTSRIFVLGVRQPA